jgi:hypothetical protein
VYRTDSVLHLQDQAAKSMVESNMARAWDNLKRARADEQGGVGAVARAEAEVELADIEYKINEKAHWHDFHREYKRLAPTVKKVMAGSRDEKTRGALTRHTSNFWHAHEEDFRLQNRNVAACWKIVRLTTFSVSHHVGLWRCLQALNPAFTAVFWNLRVRYPAAKLRRRFCETGGKAGFGFIYSRDWPDTPQSRDLDPEAR